MLVLGDHRTEYRNGEDRIVFPPRLPIHGKGPGEFWAQQPRFNGSLPRKTADYSLQGTDLHDSKSRVYQVFCPTSMVPDNLKSKNGHLIPNR